MPGLGVLNRLAVRAFVIISLPLGNSGVTVTPCLRVLPYVGDNGGQTANNNDYRELSMKGVLIVRGCLASGLTLNQPSYDFEVSSPSSPTIILFRI